MTIDTAGNVGIDATDPDHRLEIRGGNFEIQNDNADNYIRFHDPGERWFTMGIRRSDLKFYINSGGSLGATTQGIVIEDDGDVGIGTASPTQRLHVAGNANITGNLNVGGSLTVGGNTNVCSVVIGDYISRGNCNNGQLIIIRCETYNRCTDFHDWPTCSFTHPYWYQQYVNAGCAAHKAVGLCCR